MYATCLTHFILFSNLMITLYSIYIPSESKNFLKSIGSYCTVPLYFYIIIFIDNFNTNFTANFIYIHFHCRSSVNIFTNICVCRVTMLTYDLVLLDLDTHELIMYLLQTETQLKLTCSVHIHEVIATWCKERFT